MLKISPDLQIDEDEAPQVFAGILENDDFEIVKLVVETVLREGTAGMKMILLNAISSELERQKMLQGQQPSEIQKAAVERNIRELRILLAKL